MPLRTYLLCFVCLLFFISCSSQTGREESQIKQVIRWYNEALVRVYKELDLQPMEGLTTAEEIGRVRMMVWKFKAENKYMESQQKSLDFKSIKISAPGKADVETSEKWRFRHLKAGTGAVIQPWKDEEYTLHYRLTKTEGKWIVEKARLDREDLDRNPNYANHSSLIKKPAAQKAEEEK